MIELREWADRNAYRPLIVAITVVVALQLLSLGVMTALEWDARTAAMDRVADAVMLGIQQHNRPLVESSVMGGLHAARFSSVSLCFHGSPEMTYPPSTPASCTAEAFQGRSILRIRPLAGAPGFRLHFGIDVFSLVAPLAVFLFFSVGLLVAIAVILQRTRLRFSREILEPLSTGLNSERPLHITELDNLRRRNLDFHALQSRQAVAQALMALSAQVAHDIRSPLAALANVAGNAAAPHAESGGIIRSAVARISAIAEDLLSRERDSRIGGEGSQSSAREPQPLLLRPLLEPVISEAQLHRPTLLSVSFSPQSADDLRAVGEPVALGRIFSNLLSNAVDAMNGSGRVVVNLVARDSRAVLEVIDEGKGIPPDVLPKLAQRGATFGKEDGTGLGLYHARTTVESWGGRLEIESELGKGTTVRLILPRAAPPSDALVGGADSAVLIDDDPLVRMNWAVAAKRAGKALKTYPDPASFIKDAGDCARDTPIYIDSDLGEGAKGEEAAKELLALGFTELRLATGHDPASFPPLPHIKGIQGKEPPWTSA